MNLSHRFCKRVLLACAILFVLVACLVALGVIPAIRSFYPGVTAEGAVSAFWVNIGLSLLSAATCVVIAIWSKGRSRSSTSILVLFGLVVLVLGLALTSAAFTYHRKGPPLQTAWTLLFFCAAADLLGGALVVTAAFLRPRRI